MSGSRAAGALVAGSSNYLINLEMEAEYMAKTEGKRSPEVQERLAVLNEIKDSTRKYEERDIAAARARRAPGEAAQRQVRGEVWDQVPEELRRRAYEAGKAVMELELSIERTQGRLAEHERKMPTEGPKGVPEWAALKSALETQIAVYGRQLEAARAHYDEIGTKIAAIACTKLKVMVQNAQAGVQIAKLERFQLRRQADEVWQTANVRRGAVSKVLAQIVMGGVDVLYNEPVVQEEKKGRRQTK
jgi:hypothetical protein